MQQQSTPTQPPSFQAGTAGQHIFPSYADNPKKPAPAKTILPIAVSVLLLLGALYFANKELGIVDLGSMGQSTTPTPTMTAEPTQQPTPAPETNKEDVTIDVFNGSGITGQAGLIQSALESADFTNITVGNADDTTDTTVQYGSGISEEIVDEIVAILEKQGLNPTSEADDSLDEAQVTITTGSEGKVTEVTPTEEPDATTTIEPTSEATGSAQ